MASSATLSTGAAAGSHMPVKKRKTRSKQKNLRKDTRSEEIKRGLFGDASEMTAASGDKAAFEMHKANRDRCYNCGKFGHWGKDCPEPRRAKKEAETTSSVATTSEKPDNQKEQKEDASNAASSSNVEETSVALLSAGEAVTFTPAAADAVSEKKPEKAAVAVAPEKTKKRKKKAAPSEEEAAKAQPTVVESEAKEAAASKAGEASATADASSAEGVTTKKRRNRRPLKKRKTDADGSAGPKHTVFVGQLPKGEQDSETLKKDLIAHFATWECTAPVKIDYLSKSGVAFCDFENAEDKESALKWIYRSSFRGKRLLLEDKNNAGSSTSSSSSSDGPTKTTTPSEAQQSQHKSRVEQMLSQFAERAPGLLGTVDERTKEFLYSVSLGTVEATLADASKAAKKLDKKLTDQEQKSKFLMGMIKKRL
ncbi:unnamed protein product [Amoebophrya sp. A25]|nr:unnamed protein product [Amoebophrya sp. A25]|eukprot:GSA25T00008333001.1